MLSSSMNHCLLLRYLRMQDASGGSNLGIDYKAQNRHFNEEQESDIFHSMYNIYCTPPKIVKGTGIPDVC